MTDEKKQLSFIPEVEPEFDLHIPLSDITPDEYIIAPDPSRQLVESVRELGVFQPVVLYVNTSSDPWKYNIEAGRRRVMASRAVGRDTIKGLIYPDEGSVRAARVGISENAVRSANILSDLENIRRLKDKFPDMDLSTKDGINQLCRMTGMQYSVAVTRVRSLSLPKVFAEAVFQGRFPASKLETVSKLNKSSREKLAARLEAGERLRSSDVAEAKSNQTTESMAAMPQLPGFDGLDEPVDYGFYATHEGSVIIVRDGLQWLNIPLTSICNDDNSVVELVNFLAMVGQDDEASLRLFLEDNDITFEVIDGAVAHDDQAQLA